MATEAWIALAAAGGTLLLVALLLLVIQWTVGRSVRGEVGTLVQPILELTNHIMRLADQAQETKRDLEARLDEASELLRAFDESVGQLREETGQRSSQFIEFAAARETEIQETVERAHSQIMQTLDVMNWTEREASKLIEDLRCLQEEIQLEQQIRAALTQVMSDQKRSVPDAPLRFGRVTTDSPFLDFVVKAESEPARYLSIQIKALGDRYAAEALQRELERATAVQSAMPDNGLLTAAVVVNRLPDGSAELAEILGRLDDAGVELVPIDEFCAYVRDWADAGSSVRASESANSQEK